MMTRTPFLLTVVLLLPVACGQAEPFLDDASGEHGAIDSPADDPGSTPQPPANAPPDDCVGPLGPPIDTSSLPTCCEEVGGAHCFALPDSVDDLSAVLALCDGGGQCVPDAILESGGVWTPSPCTSVFGSPGVCMSRCVPAVAEKANLLPQDSCVATDLCVPCNDPVSGEPTGVCDIDLQCLEGAPPSGPETPDPDPSAPSGEACCHDMGSCLPESLVPADKLDKLEQDVCSDDADVCVPDVFVQGTALQSCTPQIVAIFGPSYQDGVCVPDCVAGTDSFFVGQDGCPEHFVCAPCYAPPFHDSTGACDAP
jgi:hypothetical protein